jgi:hypothetical protein
METSARRRFALGAWAVAVALATLGAACGSLPGGKPATAAPDSLHDLEARVRAAWPLVERYRTVERLERVSQAGMWELAAAPIATDFVLPDRKYQRPAEPTDPPASEFVVVRPTVYQRIGGVWSVVDASQFPADSPMGRSLEQLLTSGLDGAPIRVPQNVEGKLSSAGSEVLDGRNCRWYVGTALGPAGPLQLRVALEEGRDLPCKTEAEYEAPLGRVRSAVRYFDYNAAIQIEPPIPRP